MLVTDGIWKLQYPVCLFKVPVEVKGIKVNMPDCCPNQPLHGKPFCKEHTEILRDAGVPEDLLGFIKHFRPHSIPEKAPLLGSYTCESILSSYTSMYNIIGTCLIHSYTYIHM